MALTIIDEGTDFTDANTVLFDITAADEDNEDMISDDNALLLKFMLLKAVVPWVDGTIV